MKAKTVLHSTNLSSHNKIMHKLVHTHTHTEPSREVTFAVSPAFSLSLTARLLGLWERLGRDAGLANSIPNRIHAEFQLSEPPDFPFWFSPGQFTGHIILSKDAAHIRDFRLFVPNHR